MNKIKQIIATILVLVMVINASAISFASTSETFVYENNYYQIIEDSDDVFTIETENQNFVIRASLNYLTREVLLEVIDLQSFENEAVTLNEGDIQEVVTYIVSCPENSGNGLSEYIFENQVNGEMYSIGQMLPMSTIAIPLWMGLGQAAINALLAVGKAILVGYTAWVMVEEIITTIETSNEDYFEARIDNASDSVYVGDSLSRSEAIARIRLNNELYGVFCRTERLAYNLGMLYSRTEEGPLYHSNCDRVGYWPHYHSTANYQDVHIWFPGV